MFKNLIGKIKLYSDQVFLVSVIMLVSIISFGLGRLSAKYQTAELDVQSTLVNTADLDKIATGPSLKSVVQKNTSPTNENREVTASNSIRTGNKKIVGNKNSKIYHYEDCPGALKMKEESRVFFISALEAKTAGFRPAGNCPGLE